VPLVVVQPRPHLSRSGLQPRSWHRARHRPAPIWATTASTWSSKQLEREGQQSAFDRQAEGAGQPAGLHHRIPGQWPPAAPRPTRPRETLEESDRIEPRWRASPAPSPLSDGPPLRAPGSPDRDLSHAYGEVDFLFLGAGLEVERGDSHRFRGTQWGRPNPPCLRLIHWGLEQPDEGNLPTGGAQRGWPAIRSRNQAEGPVIWAKR